jgi:hypothetical protein
MQSTGSEKMLLVELKLSPAVVARELQDYLDNFKERNEFWYVKRDSCSGSENEERSDEKWWIPIVKVPPGGLSPTSRGWLLHQKELVNQVLKAAMAINANCLMEMSIPDTYIDTLPKVLACLLVLGNWHACDLANMYSI